MAAALGSQPNMLEKAVKYMNTKFCQYPQSPLPLRDLQDHVFHSEAWGLRENNNLHLQ